MAGQSDAMRAWTYTSNSGARTFRLRAKTAIVAQVDGSSNVKVGGASSSSAVALPPRGFRPRKVYCTSAAGVKRAVVLYDADAPLATQGEVITLQYAGAETVFTSTGCLLEERILAGITDAV